MRRSLAGAQADRAYFGMPGRAMLDVIAWGSFVNRAFCVEANKTELGIMQSSALAAGLLESCTFLRGRVEEILRSGLDADGIAVPDAGFDVVNLDFEGSLFQKDQAERLDAIDELFRRQRRRIQSFVLFVTIGFRSVRRRPMDEVVRKFRRHRSGASP